MASLAAVMLALTFWSALSCFWPKLWLTCSPGWGFGSAEGVEALGVHPASKTASKARRIGLLLEAVQGLLGLGFKTLELGRILAEDQKATDAANQKSGSEGEDVVHRIKGQTICLAGTA